MFALLFKYNKDIGIQFDRNFRKNSKRGYIEKAIPLLQTDC